jgi:hypothetical protein
MEKFVKQSGGSWVSGYGPEAQYAIIPLHVSGIRENGDYFFEFKPEMIGDALVIEWDPTLDICFLAKEYATMLLNKEWAINIPDKFAADLNDYLEKQGQANNDEFAIDQVEAEAAAEDIAVAEVKVEAEAAAEAIAVAEVKVEAEAKDIAKAEDPEKVKPKTPDQKFFGKK